MLIKKILGKFRKIILQNVREKVLAEKYFDIINNLNLKKKKLEFWILVADMNH
tara:strand:- start:600 stop:758 length:159 start_codon:yes stop_codon:yes gene_type:complete